MGNILSQLTQQQGQQQSVDSNPQYTGQPGSSGIHFGRPEQQAMIGQGINSLIPLGMVIGPTEKIAESAFDRETGKALSYLDDLSTKFDTQPQIAKKVSKMAEDLVNMDFLRGRDMGSNEPGIKHYIETMGIGDRKFSADEASKYFKNLREFAKSLGHDFDKYDPEKGIE